MSMPIKFPKVLYKYTIDNNTKVYENEFNIVKGTYNIYTCNAFPDTKYTVELKDKEYTIIGKVIDITPEREDELLDQAEKNFYSEPEWTQNESSVDDYYNYLIDEICFTGYNDLYSSKKKANQQCKANAIYIMNNRIGTAINFLSNLEDQKKRFLDALASRVEKEEQRDPEYNYLYRYVSGNIFSYKVLEQIDNVYKTECQACSHGSKCIVHVIEDDNKCIRYLSCDQSDQVYWHCDDEFFYKKLDNVVKHVKEKYMDSYSKSKDATSRNLEHYRQVLDLWNRI